MGVLGVCREAELQSRGLTLKLLYLLRLSSSGSGWLSVWVSILLSYQSLCTAVRTLARELTLTRFVALKYNLVK